MDRPIESIRSPFHSALNAVANLLRMLGRFLRAIEHRGEIRALAELDERTLKDIGLSPGDVDTALAEPFFRNPSLVLVRVADERSKRERPLARQVRPIVPVIHVVR